MADARPLLESYGLYIDGRWVEPENGRYDDISPATEATIAQAPDASLADVDAAMSAARRAFDAGPWAHARPTSAPGASTAGRCADASTPTSSSRCRRPSGAAPRTSD